MRGLTALKNAIFYRFQLFSCQNKFYSNNKPLLTNSKHKKSSFPHTSDMREWAQFYLLMPLPAILKGSKGETGKKTGDKSLTGNQRKAGPEPGLSGASLLKAHLF